MSDSVDRLSDALADRYRIERELGAGGMAVSHQPTAIGQPRSGGSVWRTVTND